ncbi:carbohydrate kinase family protein [Candidatus Micrarchaeota archaeon]|nr:carbohydrate kinase family protein [Candidatus Micrarchaeota archaeon]MBU2476564.1 carbohydrate kinase family protein [Candidatus Micrarchaeota archaeon]
MKSRIVSIGSATEDIFVKTDEFHFRKSKSSKGTDLCLKLGKKFDIEEIHFDYGGGALNTSLGFKKMGFNANVLISLGNDSTARKIEKILKIEGINLIAVPSEKETGFSVIFRKPKGDRTIMTYRGANNHWQEKKINWNALKKMNWIYVSSFGSNISLLEKIAGFCKKNKINLAFNPGASQRKIGLEKLKKVVKECKVIILNKEEITEWTKKKNEMDAMRELNELGAKIVVVTDGRKGSYAFNGKKVFRQKAMEVERIDVTGAGDAFSVGFVSAIDKKKNIQQALKIGTANACSVIRRIGAHNGILSFNGAENFVKKYG